MTTDNVQTFRESVEAFNNNNWDRFRALATDDCIIHGSRGDQTIDEYIDGIKERDAIEDSEVQIEDIFGDGDRVTCRYTNTVTINGTYQGSEISNKEVSNPGITIIGFEDGSITDVWLVADISVRWEEAGVLPDRFLD